MNILCMCKKQITQHTIMHLKNTMAPPEADLFQISRWPVGPGVKQTQSFLL